MNPDRLAASYRCLSCAYEWQKPMARNMSDGTGANKRQWMESSGSDCPRCGHFYVKWTNYETLAERLRA